ncbi:MFS transporter [Streptomyces sp. NPDC001393]
MQRPITRKLLDALPPPGAARVLTLNAFAGSIGTGLFLTGSMLFFTRSVGLPAYQVALGLSIAGVAGMVASVPTGMLADRIGPRRTMVALHLWRVVTYSLYLLVHSFPAFLAVICATTLAEKAGPPINQAMVGTLFTKQQRTRTMAFLRAVRNVGLSLGALLAGIALSYDTRVAYDSLALGNALSFLVMAALIWSLHRYEPARDSSAPATAAPGDATEEAPAADRRPLREWPFLALSGFNGVLALHDSVLFVGLPLWISAHTDAPRQLVSAVLIVNTVITALTQVRWTRLTDSTAKAVRGMVTAGLALAVAAVAVLAAHYVGSAAACALLVLGVLLLTVGENLHSSAAWEVSFNLSPADARSRYLAVFQLGESARDIVGPLLVTSAMAVGPWGWLGLAAAFALAGFAARTSADRVERRRARAHANEPAATESAEPAATASAGTGEPAAAPVTATP